MTPAQRHKIREEAKRATSLAAESGGEIGGSHYELMLHQLAQQKRTLKAIKSLTKKCEVKAELLPEWADYIDGALSADVGVQDEIIGQLMIWAIDASDYDLAIKIGKHMIQHNLLLPAHFARETEEALTEEIAEAWIKSDAPTISVEQLREVEQITSKFDMHDQIRAKLYRALGEAEHKAGNDLAAIVDLTKAITLDDRIGCKQLLAKLEKAHPDFSPDQNLE